MRYCLGPIPLTLKFWCTTDLLARFGVLEPHWLTKLIPCLVVHLLEKQLVCERAPDRDPHDCPLMRQHDPERGSSSRELNCGYQGVFEWYWRSPIMFILDVYSGKWYWRLKPQTSDLTAATTRHTKGAKLTNNVNFKRACQNQIVDSKPLLICHSLWTNWKRLSRNGGLCKVCLVPSG